MKTRMIWGLQWDATCNWLADSKFDITYSSKWGNYSDNDATGHGNIQNTGYSENWKANNIYDFAGNFWEFTQEACGTDGTYHAVCRALRGGGFYNRGSSYPASYRLDNYPTYASNSNGSRPTLYLIP